MKLLHSKLGKRFWTAYTFFWGLYFLAYIPVIVFGVGASFQNAISSAIVNVFPVSLLSILIIKFWLYLSHKISLQKQLLIHSILLPLFTLFWWFLISLGISVYTWAVTKEWSLSLLLKNALLWQIFQGALMYVAIASVAYILSYWENLRKKDQALTQAKLDLAEMELQVLRAQLNPHLLFNTLHSLNSLIMTNPQKACQAIDSLGNIFRKVLELGEKGNNLVSLGEEIKFVKEYLMLQKFRHGDRLKLVIRLSDNTKQVMIPAFTLQTLVENSIIHALEKSTQPVCISIKASVTTDISPVLNVVVQDDGPGFQSQKSKNQGKGLNLVKKCLENAFPGKTLFKTEKKLSNGFSTSFQIPAEV